VEKEEYRISFFKPTTLQAKTNRNLIVKLFISWAVAIFGFQILLRVIEKPVPEDALITFSSAWENIESGSATYVDYQDIAQSMIQVMGKITIKPDDYDALKDGTGWALSKVYPEDDLSDLQQDVQHLNLLKEQITSLRDEEYLETKELIISKAAPALGIGEGTLLAQLLAIGLNNDLQLLTEESRKKIPEIMSLYLTHNRSVLTDTVFLGFPFHYFYTAVLLLVLFIGLCWIYCYRTDKLHAKLNFLEKID
jgi:putative solute:sodium symporter small subunit